MRSSLHPFFGFALLVLPVGCGVSTEDFARAVICGEHDDVRKIIAAGADSSVRFGGDPILLIAAHRDHAAVIEDLVAAGADIDATNNGHTAVIEAIQQNHPDSLLMLIDAGAEIDGIGYGSSVLVLAAELSHQECIDTLLVAKANADRHTSKSWTAAVSRRITGNRMP